MAIDGPQQICELETGSALEGHVMIGTKCTWKSVFIVFSQSYHAILATLVECPLLKRLISICGGISKNHRRGSQSEGATTRVFLRSGIWLGGRGISPFRSSKIV